MHPSLPPLLKWIEAQKSTESHGTQRELPWEPQPHPVLRQPSNVEQPWTFICMRQAHDKKYIEIIDNAERS